jgi:hypothetical protein
MLQPTPQEKNLLKNSIIIILLFLLVLFGYKTILTLGDNRTLENKLITAIYNDSMRTLQVKTKDGLITTQEQLLTNKNQEIVKHIEKENKMSSLIGQIKYNTSIKVVHDTIRYKDSTKLVEIIDTINGKIDSFKCLPLPVKIENIDSNLQMYGVITEDGFVIEHLNIPNKVEITIGDVKKGLFKTESIVKIKNSNKYLEQSDTKNIFVKQNISKKPIKTFVIGGVIGFSVATLVETLFYVYTHK